MKQYVIIGRDGQDANALDRRMKERPAHLAGARKLKDQKNYVLGGAMLDDQGQMIGSVMIVQFETEEELQNWIKQERYVAGKVWDHYEVIPFRVAEL